MDTTPYTVGYWHGFKLHSVTVKPCCDKNNVVDYGIYKDDQLAFNITKTEENGKWVISLKNADRLIEDELVQNIGAEIDKHNLSASNQ